MSARTAMVPLLHAYAQLTPAFLPLSGTPYTLSRSHRFIALATTATSAGSAHTTSQSRSYATHKSGRKSPYARSGSGSDSASSSGSGSGSGSGSSSSSASATSESTAELLRRLEASSRRAGGSSGFGGQDRVGPMPLGMGSDARNRTWRKWGELGMGGKLWRTTQQAGNLTVILVGGGLLVVFTLALTTELFASNSPNVLYSQAVDLIRGSDALDPHLLPPYSFTHSPHSSAPSRGTSPIASAFARHPSSGRDHLLLTFWVHGRGINEPESMGWLKSSWGAVKDNVMWVVKSAGIVGPEEVDLDGTAGAGARAGEQAQEARLAPQSQGGSQTQSQSGGWWSSLLGGGAGLKSGQRGAAGRQGSRRALPPAGTYKIGEVRADYVKDEAGTYQLLSLIVDVPSSKAPYPGEAVVFWSPEADKEALQVRRR